MMIRTLTHRTRIAIAHLAPRPLNAQPHVHEHRTRERLFRFSVHLLPSAPFKGPRTFWRVLSGRLNVLIFSFVATAPGLPALRRSSVKYCSSFSRRDVCRDGGRTHDFSRETEALGSVSRLCRSFPFGSAPQGTVRRRVPISCWRRVSGPTRRPSDLRQKVTVNL